MANPAALQFNGILYLKFTVALKNPADICLLPAHRCIKWCFLNNYCAILPICQCLYHLILCSEHTNLWIMWKLMIPHKLTGNFRVNLLIDCLLRTHIICCLSGLSCFILLFFHGICKAFFIHTEPFLFQYLNCQVKREPIRIIQFKCILTRQLILPCTRKWLLHLRKNG